jgi:hypothetical protein
MYAGEQISRGGGGGGIGIELGNVVMYAGQRGALVEPFVFAQN